MNSTLPPRALQHQANIVTALVKTFELPEEVLEAMQRGGARTSEKLIRSYHYWASEYNGGLCPYDHPKIGYFRMTKEAASFDGPTKGLHCEHVVPVKWLTDRLMSIRKHNIPTRPEVEKLMRLNEIVVVTKIQSKLVDKNNRKSMPEDWVEEQGHLIRLVKSLKIFESDLVGERLIGPK